MACANKMCFSKAEYIEIKQLWLQTRKKQKKELGGEIWMYPFDQLEHSTYDNGYKEPPVVHYKYDPVESNLDIDWMNDVEEDYTIFNVNTKTELWLLKNFDLPCIKREVGKQLGSIFYQEIPKELQFNLVDELDFSTPDSLYCITGSNVQLYLYDQVNEEEIDVHEHFLVYGTTEAIRILDSVQDVLDGFSKDDYTIEFSFCGLQLTYENKELIYVGDNLEYKNKPLVIPYIKPNFSYITVKHSYELEDSKDLNKGQIIVSGNIIGTLNSWEDFDYPLNQFLFRQLPDYIRKLIK
jgi:hypothetical protein